ncbi:B-cell receptor CD22-like [Discoglossus pictus]
MRVYFTSIENILLLFFLQGCFSDSDSKGWSFSFPAFIKSLKGSCVVIPCTFTHPEGSENFSLIWYSYALIEYPQVFNSRDSTGVSPDYKSRTSLVGNTTNSCSLRINNVKVGDYKYYPGINNNINSWHLHNKKAVDVMITGSPDHPQLTIPDSLTEGVTVIVSCSVEHTCASSPPNLTWNKVGHRIRKWQEEPTGGYYRVVTEMMYYPSYQDNNTLLACMATYPNGQTTDNKVILNIKYAPKNTTISIVGKKPVKEGDNVTLNCSCQSNPGVHNYTWYKVGANKDITLQDHNKMVTVKNVSWENEKYYCSAINAVGRGDSHITEIPVQYTAKDIQVKQEKKESDIINLVCQFSRSNPQPTSYTWYSNGIPIANEFSQILRLTNIKAQTEIYKCVAHNEAGNSSSLPVQVSVIADGTNDDMTAILGSIAGVIILILLLLVLYIYFRWRGIQKSTSPKNTRIKNNVHHTTAHEEIRMDEHLYGNVQPQPCYNHNSKPDSISIQNLEYSNLNFDALNSKKKNENDEIHYASIQHHPPNKNAPNKKEENNEIHYASVQHHPSNKDTQNVETEYAVLKL